MAITQKTKLLTWIIAFTLIMACIPSFTTESVPTIDPGAINTFIVQTAHAAATQTAALLPSATPTLTITPTRNTPTITPTPTSTVIFLFFTPTPLVVSTITNAPSSSDTFACQIMTSMPPDRSKLHPREDFDALWRVRNIGKRRWDRTTVRYVYSSGAKIHKISSYDLPKSMGVGDTQDLVANMQAPKDPGTYTTTWSIYTGSKYFCPMTLTIVVEEPPNQTTATATATP